MINKFLGIPPIIIDTADKVVTGIKIANTIQSFIPSTVGTPNPVGPILVVKDLIEKLEDLMDLMKSKLSSGTVTLSMILEELRKVLLMLEILDALIQSCAAEYSDNEDSTLADQAVISNDLLESTQEQSNQLSPVVTNYNGFEMAVITIDTVTVGGLKRRRAVARNSQGIIMLQGDPSFSSNDQILIDQLIFYIDQNDLKAL